ncbi:MAG: MFS transporter [Amphritea sp.]|nr:MFS transporter [Amphritea sp.]
MTGFRLFATGLLQLLIILSLGGALLYAAYLRTEGAELMVPENWVLNAGSVALAALIAGAFWLLRQSPDIQDQRRSQLLMGVTLIGLVALLGQHLMYGDRQVSIIDIGAALLIAFLILVELTVFQQGRIRQQQEAFSYKQMRPAIFLFLFGIDLSMSFIPLHMETLPQSLSGIAPDLLIGLPISVEFLCVGIAILGCGVWLDRSGWQKPFYTGLVLTGIGCLYSWLAPDAVQFIISRGILGFGYGLTLLASQGYVISQTDSSNKARGLAHLFAGLYSGSICGAATGAVMAEQFGYGAVFLTGAMIVFSVIFYSVWSLNNRVRPDRKPDPVKATAPASKPVKAGLGAFLFNRHVLAATLFSSMPASIAVVGFINYFSPVYLDRAGVNDAMIGQVLMLFGVILALFGPAIGRFADASDTKRLPIVLGCILGGLAFLVFQFSSGITAVTLAVLLLGLSNSLVLSAQSAFVLKQPVTQGFGEGKAMGIFRSSSRIGQMLGPVIFAVIVATANIDAAVVWFGIAYLVTAALFWILTVQVKEQDQPVLEAEAHD